MVKELYKEWIHYIINTIGKLDCSEYNNQPSFTIPYLGKLVCEEYKLNAINSKLNERSKFKEDTSKK